MEFECNCCGSKKFEKLIDLGDQPYANKYPKTQNSKDEFKDNLTIQICAECYTAKTEVIAPRDTMFEEYFYLSSINKELVNHFKDLSEMIPVNSKVLDIGSNDGIFLKPCIDKGINAIGIDPSENVGKIANEKGLTTIIGFFDNDHSKFIKDKYGYFDYIVASSIFTHVENSHEFIENVYQLLKDDGTFILEIEYIKNIINKLEYERFYFDRPYYFSINGINSIFNEYGLFIHKIEEIAPHGGSLRFYIKKKIFNNKTINQIKLDEELFFKELLKNNFQQKVIIYSNELKNFLIDCQSNTKKVIAFGCPARFSTITNFAKIGPDLIPFVIDDSPIKQNKFSPGMSIPIVKRDFIFKYKPDLIIVFAYEYFSSIYEFTKQFDINHFKPIPLQKLNTE